jgi:glycosyltransferase involved in cell wall biosynthesis
MPRIAVVASHVIQYQDPFFRKLAAAPGIDVTVLFCSREGANVYRDVDMQTSLRWDIELLQGYRHRFLRNIGWGQGFVRLVNPGIAPAIVRGRYDAVLFMTGWAWATAWLGFAACRIARVPIFLFGDSSFIPDEHSLRARIRSRVIRALFRRTAAFMISGTFNAGYYKHYGGDERRFFPMPWAIDNERFGEAGHLRPGEREELRARYGIAPGKMVALYSGKLIERKDPRTLLAAFASMRHRDRAALVFMGDGALRPELERIVKENEIPDVHFIGFVNQTEIPKHYAMADVFALPSAFDPRATVVNEAMVSGLPLILTDRCGPVGDIARQDNAFVMKFGDRDTLRDALDRLTADPDLRRRMGERSREIIAPWSYDAGIEGIRQACRAVAAAGERPPGNTARKEPLHGKEP